MKATGALVLAVMVSLFMTYTASAVDSFDDIPMGALPADSVKEAMQKSLSPQGRFAILQQTGMVRVFDNPANIAAARAAMQAMQNAPAIISFVIAFKTGMHEVIRGVQSGPGYGAQTGGVVSGYEVPVVNGYGGPQMIVSGRGAAGVAPGTPGNFQTRWVDRGGGQFPNRGQFNNGGGYGYGGYVYQGGYVTGTEINAQETCVEGGVVRNFTGSTLFPKPVAVALCAKVPDAAALREWAIANAGVPADEPPWTVACTEVAVTPLRTDDGIVLNLLPRVVVAGAGGKPRVIPLKVLSASVTAKQSVPATFDGFPGADADFYRLFLGAEESAGDAMSSITVIAAVKYLPPQPQQPAAAK